MTVLAIASFIAQRCSASLISNRILRRDTSPNYTPDTFVPTAVTSLDKTATARVDQLRTIDKSRLLNQLGTLSSGDMEQIEKGLRVVLGL